MSRRAKARAAAADPDESAGSIQPTEALADGQKSRRAVVRLSF